MNVGVFRKDLLTLLTHRLHSHSLEENNGYAFHNLKFEDGDSGTASDEDQVLSDPDMDDSSTPDSASLEFGIDADDPVKDTYHVTYPSRKQQSEESCQSSCVTFIKDQYEEILSRENLQPAPEITGEQTIQQSLDERIPSRNDDPEINKVDESENSASHQHVQCDSTIPDKRKWLDDCDSLDSSDEELEQVFYSRVLHPINTPDLDLRSRLKSFHMKGHYSVKRCRGLSLSDVSRIATIQRPSLNFEKMQKTPFQQRKLLNCGIVKPRVVKIKRNNDEYGTRPAKWNI